MASGHLTVDRVNVSFGTVPVLDGVSLEVAAGSITAVVGPSGSGKSSLLRIIAGFLSGGSGRITLDGADITRTAPHRRSVGLVPQDGALFPHLTVARNIAFGLPRRRMGRTAVNARVRELLALVDLDEEFAPRRPDQLSGGQRQRVALARALARRPDLMLLDEPFSALDAGLRERTRKAVRGIMRHTGTSTVLVTHDQDEALSFADQVAVLDGGHIAQAGTPRDVYSAPADLGTARFLGDAVTLDAVVRRGTAQCDLGSIDLLNRFPDGEATLLLRPEQIGFVESGHGRSGTVTDTDYFGGSSTVTVRLDGSPESVRIRLSGSAPPAPGAGVALTVHGCGVAYRRAVTH